MLKRRLLIIQYITGYSLVLLLPLCLVLYIYTDMMGIIEREVYKSQLSILENSSDLVDQNLIGLNSIVNRIRANLTVNRFAFLVSPLDDLKSIMIIKDLNAYLATYTADSYFFDRIYVYSQKAGALVSNTASVIRLDQYYGSSLQIRDMSYEQWEADFLNVIYSKDFMYNVRIKCGSVTDNYLIFADTIPHAGSWSITNTYVFIPQKNLLGMFSSIPDLDTGWFYISDDEGNIITDNAEVNVSLVEDIENGLVGNNGYFIKNINDTKMFITYVNGSQNNFKYVCAIRLDSILGKIRSIKILLNALIITTFLVGIIMVLMLSYRSSKPFEQIMQALSKLSVKTNPPHNFDFINTELSRLINNQELLKQELAAQLPTQRIAMLYRLLNGDVVNDSESIKCLHNLDIDTQASLYAVIIVYFNSGNIGASHEDANTCKALFNRLLQSSELMLIGTYDIDIDSETVLLSSRSDNSVQFTEEIDAFARAAGEELKKAVKVNVSFSASMTDNIVHIHKAYHEARTSTDYFRHSDNTNVMWYTRDESTSNLFFYYPIEKEMSLISSVVKGNIQDCRDVLNCIYKMNFALNSLPCTVGSKFLNCIVSSLHRISEKLPDKRNEIGEYLQSLPNELEECSDIKGEYINIRKYILNLCMQVHSAQNRHKNFGIESVIAYIDENYQDYQISLSSVAARFAVTENYLSRYFKEQTNEKFSKYIEQLRMEKARELITEQKLSVSETAGMVGYIYPQVFRRVYKRYFGITPSETKNVKTK